VSCGLKINFKVAKQEVILEPREIFDAEMNARPKTYAAREELPRIFWFAISRNLIADLLFNFASTAYYQNQVCKFLACT